MASWLASLSVISLALAASLGAAAAALPAVTAFRAEVVVSGSMAPAIPVGSLILTGPLSGPAAPGDIITFTSPFRPATVVHRVVAVEAGAEDSDYVTKGDANSSIDGWRISTGAATGKVIAVIPLVGYAIGTLQRPSARVGVGLLVLALLLPSFRRPGRRSASATAGAAAADPA
jgi:signal peptidase